MERRRTLSTNTEGGRSKANSPTPRGERGQTASPSLDRLGHGVGKYNQSEDTSSLASLSLRYKTPRNILILILENQPLVDCKYFSKHTFVHLLLCRKGKNLIFIFLKINIFIILTFKKKINQISICNKI